MPKLKELDFAKGVLIYLMVMFHLPLPHSIRDIHGIVYAFHMSGFLVMSGFLSNFDKTVGQFFKNYLRKILVPFIVFEFIYLTLLYLSAQAGINTANSNSFTDFTLTGIGVKLFLNPIGTYWYLHTLFIGVCVAFLINLIFKKLNIVERLIFTATSYWFISIYIPGFTFENALYLLIGIALKEKREFIPSSIWAIVPFLLIIMFSTNELSRFSVQGAALTILFLSFLCGIYNIIKTYEIINVTGDYFSFIGRNTISIVILSPLLTSISKLTLKYFAVIDPSGFLFLFIATISTVHISFIGIRFLDTAKLSYLILGTHKAFSEYKFSSQKMSNRNINKSEVVNELASEKPLANAV